MIQKILQFLIEQLNENIEQKNNGAYNLPAPVALLESIVHLDDQELRSKNNLFLFLYNISEGLHVKNNPGYFRTGTGEMHNRNALFNTNIHILITAVMSKYDHELYYLSEVLRFFHDYPVFSYENREPQVEGLPSRFTIVLDFQSVSIEQTALIWNALGNRHYPFLCYKLRIMEL